MIYDCDDYEEQYWDARLARTGVCGECGNPETDDIFCENCREMIEDEDE